MQYGYGSLSESVSFINCIYISTLWQKTKNKKKLKNINNIIGIWLFGKLKCICHMDCIYFVFTFV